MIKHVGKHNTAIKIAVAGCLLASLAVIAFSDRTVWDWLPLAFSICSAALLYVHYIRFEQETSSESERTQRLSDVYRKTAEALASAIAAKDGYEQHHVRRVEMICEMMAKQLRLREDDIDGIRVAALLHDVGKLGVPEYILLKPGPLDPDEFSKMRNHAVIGAQVLTEVNYPWDVAGMVRHHHENYDGTGYPNQLAGEKIPLGSRIIAVAEVYDALVCARCYKEGWSHLEAVEHIQKLSGTRFDPKVVSAFIEVAPEVARIKEPHKPAYTKNEGAIVTGENFAAADMIARANQELISLFEITQTLSSTLELDEVLSLLTHRTRRLSQSATCAVFLVDELHPQSMVARIASGRWQEMIQGATVRIGRGVTGKAAAKMTSYIGNYDPNDLALGMDAHAQVNFSSCMVAPIVNFGKLLGTINVYDVSAHAFSSDDLRTLGFVAGRAAVAIENANAFEQVRDSAIRDPLTNLHNGGYLISFLQRELRRSERLGGRASVIGIDLDNFKAINDSMGHQEGDRVLREVASIFCGQLREYDQAFRNGGDEFVVVLPDTPSSEAVRVAARIQNEVDRYAAGMADTVGVKLGASVGVATYPKDADNPEELLAKADANMYENKRARKQGKLAA